MLVAAFPGEVRVLAPADEGGDPRVVRHPRPFMWPTRSVRRWVEAQVADFRPDVVLFGAPHPLALLGPGLRRATGVPYAVVCHGAEVFLPAAVPGLRQALRRALRRADAVFGVSRYTRGRVERFAGRPVRYLGAGVEAVFTPGEPPERPVVGCVSRFVPRKGQRRVLRAVARLRAEGRDLSVLLVGMGRDEDDLRRLAARLGVPTRMEVAVPWAALPGLYREMTAVRHALPLALAGPGDGGPRPGVPGGGRLRAAGAGGRLRGLPGDGGPRGDRLRGGRRRRAGGGPAPAPRRPRRRPGDGPGGPGAGAGRVHLGGRWRGASPPAWKRPSPGRPPAPAPGRRLDIAPRFGSCSRRSPPSRWLAAAG